MLDFFTRLNNAPRNWSGTKAELSVDEFGAYSSDSIRRQYLADPHNAGRSFIRLSALGKPAVETAIKHPDVKAELLTWGFHNDPFDETMLLTFALGDWFENWVGFQLRRLGYHIETCVECSTDGQHMVEFEGVKGHLDFIVNDPETNERFVLEVKTMSTNYFQQFFDVKYNESDMFILRPGAAGDDERGYMTQLATYMHHTGLPGYWIALDKGTRKLAVGSPCSEDVDRALARGRRIIPILNGIEKLEDVFTRLRPPPGVPEVYKRQLTGRLKLPSTMAYSPVKNVFYKITEAKNGYGKLTEYVGKFDIEEYISQLEDPSSNVDGWLMAHTKRLTYGEAKTKYLVK